MNIRDAIQRDINEPNAGAAVKLAVIALADVAYSQFPSRKSSLQYDMKRDVAINVTFSDVVKPHAVIYHFRLCRSGNSDICLIEW